MPNIAPIIAPSQPSATPSASPSAPGGSDSSFETILNETAAAHQQSDADTKHPANNQPKTEPLESDADTTHLTNNQSETEPLDTTTSQNTDQANESSTTNAAAAGNESTIIRYGDLQKTLELRALTRVLLDGGNQTASAAGKDAEQINIPVGLLQNSAFATGKKEGQTLLTAELEQLITLHEKGVVTITKQDGTQVSLADLQNLKGASLDAATLPTQNSSVTDAMVKNQIVTGDLRQTNIEQQAGALKLTEDPTIKGGLAKVVVVEDEVATVARNNDNQATHLRQDSRGQYLDAKLNANSPANSGSGNSPNQESNQQDISNNAQAQSGIQTSQQTAATETTQSYSQVSQGVLDTPVAKAATVMHPASPFPGSTVSDEAIVQQVANKFNLQVRNQETQINIRLHPAELGELKIDLTYRQGAIRANVFAQSQHVQEILEKNMPKLRELLQGQGIQVEEIQVSAKSDIAGGFDLLQDQLGKRDSYDQQQNGNRLETETFIDALESASVQGQEDQSRVNVTV